MIGQLEARSHSYLQATDIERQPAATTSTLLLGPLQPLAHSHEVAVAVDLADVAVTPTSDSVSTANCDVNGSSDSDCNIRVCEAGPPVTAEVSSFETESVAGDKGDNSGVELGTKEKHALLKTAMLTGIAIMLHNVPEGLATFVAAAKDPAVGVGDLSRPSLCFVQFPRAGFGEFGAFE
jgi:zinc transporter ZupT